MTSFEGNLCNGAGDIVIDALLSIFAVVAFIPQIDRIRTHPSMTGLSPYYILFNALLSNAQLSEALIFVSIAYPETTFPVMDDVLKGNIKGFAAVGSLFGVVQIFLCWFCSILCTLYYTSRSPGEPQKPKTISIAAFLHAAIVLLPAIPFALKDKRRRDMGDGVVGGLIIMVNTVCGPCFMILQFIAQLWENKTSHGEPGALSLLSLGLQAAAAGLIAVRWFLRTGTPPWDDHPTTYEWYQWGYLPFNCTLIAITCLILLGSYVVRFSAVRVEDFGGAEQTPLLA